MGEQNVKVGKEEDDEIFGKFMLGICNECSEKWVEFLHSKQLNSNQHIVSRIFKAFMEKTEV